MRECGKSRVADGNAEQTTERRSTLRIQREAELLGSDLYTHHSRENLVIGAKFLRDDLPYFVELLAEVATMTKYTSTSRFSIRVKRAAANFQCSTCPS